MGLLSSSKSSGADGFRSPLRLISPCSASSRTQKYHSVWQGVRQGLRRELLRGNKSYEGACTRSDEVMRPDRLERAAVVAPQLLTTVSEMACHRLGDHIPFRTGAHSGITDIFKLPNPTNGSSVKRRDVACLPDLS